MGDILGELRLAIRTWTRRPGFAAVVVATLAIGIGADVAVYTVIDGVLLRAFPYRAPENLDATLLLRPK